MVFFKIIPSEASNRIAPVLDDKVIKDERWAQRVAMHYHDLKMRQSQEDPFQNLANLKIAINEVSTKLAEELKLQSSRSIGMETDDRIGWIMRAVRAIEKGHRGPLLKCIAVYPEIGRLINPYRADIRSTPGFTALRDLAIQIYREELLVELRDIQRDSETLGDSAANSRKSRAQTLLSRIKPGKCEAIAALQLQDGTITSDSQAILAELQRYWGEVFAHNLYIHVYIYIYIYM